MNNKGFKFLLVSIFSLGIINCSGGGSDSSPDPEPVNQKPTANAGADQTVDEQTAVTVEGSGTDSDGTIASYSWAQTSGPQITLSNTSQQNLEFTAPVAKQATSIEFTLTVTDNDGASGSDSVIVTVNPVDEQKVTLQGVVTDEPIANAQVSVAVAGTTYTTTADTDGNYTLEIGVDEDQEISEAVVIVSAEGVDEQSYVHLKSVVGSFGSILEQAGDDNILTAEENNGVDVTHISTAILGQLKYRNENELPLTLSELEAAALKLDGTAVLGMAASIKFLVDYSSTNQEAVLPEGVSNTWELVSNVENYRTFYGTDWSVETENTFADIQNEIFTSQDLITAYQATPEFYIHTTGDLAKLTGYYDFDTSEQATYIYSEYPHQGQWLNTGAELEVVLLTDVVVSTVSVYRGSGYVSQEKSYDSKKLRLLKSFTNIDIVIETTNGTYHYPNNPEIADESFVEHGIAVMTKKLIPLSEDDVVGQLMLPLRADFLNYTEERVTNNYGILTNDIKHDASSFELTPSGMVYNSMPQLGDGVWTLNEDGTLTLTLSGATIEVIKTSENNVGVIVKDSLLNNKGFLGGNIALRQTPSLWDESNVVGLYELEGDLTSPELSFLVYLKEDQTGYQATGVDENGDGVADSSEYNFEPVQWRLEAGKLVVERYRDASFNYCESLTPDCFVFNRRTLDLFEMNGDYFYTINQHSFNYHPLMFGEINEEFSDFWYFENYDTRRWKKHAEGTLQFP
ncbi:PKD domain-containing protein [Kangiella sp. M94]